MLDDLRCDSGTFSSTWGVFLSDSDRALGWSCSHFVFYNCPIGCYIHCWTATASNCRNTDMRVRVLFYVTFCLTIRGPNLSASWNVILIPYFVAFSCVNLIFDVGLMNFLCVHFNCTGINKHFTYTVAYLWITSMWVLVLYFLFDWFGCIVYVHIVANAIIKRIEIFPQYLDVGRWVNCATIHRKDSFISLYYISYVPHSVERLT